MKIYNRKDFLTLPAGTVFFDYKPHTSGSLSIKTSGPDEYLPDFCRQDINALCIESDNSEELFDKMDMFENGTERPLALNDASRDAMFGEDAHFAVLDEADLERLVHVLTKAWRR